MKADPEQTEDVEIIKQHIDQLYLQMKSVKDEFARQELQKLIDSQNRRVRQLINSQQRRKYPLPKYEKKRPLRFSIGQIYEAQKIATISYSDSIKEQVDIQEWKANLLQILQVREELVNKNELELQQMQKQTTANWLLNRQKSENLALKQNSLRNTELALKAKEANLLQFEAALNKRELQLNQRQQQFSNHFRG